MSDKASRDALRQQLKRARTALDASTRASATQTIAKHLDVLLIELAPHTVAGYAALGGELSITEALSASRAAGRVSLLPILTGDTLAFAAFDASTPMKRDRYGIEAPVVDKANLIAPADIDVVLVPLVGFDERLDRLGMGGGFYDRSFARRRETDGPPFLVGVAFECQRADDVQPDWWDVPLDALVTETGVRRRE